MFLVWAQVQHDILTSLQGGSRRKQEVQSGFKIWVALKEFNLSYHNGDKYYMLYQGFWMLAV